MNNWSNIQISPEDAEVIAINNLEATLGQPPMKVMKVRELITRFEICHFKYQQHLKKIKDSIVALEPSVDVSKIGVNHVQHGESAWKKDKTGKSLVGQQYIWAIKGWLNDHGIDKDPDNFDQKLAQKVRKWIGDKSGDKERLVRLLLARLTWDWKSYEALQHGGEFEVLELQICRMDICHYAFPTNLNMLLRSIGKMKPSDHFEGCGSYDKTTKKSIEKELSALGKMLTSFRSQKDTDRKLLMKIWLIACLMKTLKKLVELQAPPIEL